ncbi:hypothetical protein RLDS_06670 [Sphingobium lactosutens DS20]|uniref:Uncharacterized protein n=1 Tax=Sphingobium lactosutens DS20 TaxID=1331060 RepID=T0HKF3_9SPHN|nr:hypothetical protein RLDS_06670 [Sphingobium lactosutens DS20]
MKYLKGDQIGDKVGGTVVTKVFASHDHHLK